MYNICLCPLNCYCKADFFLQKDEPAYQLKFCLTVEGWKYLSSEPLHLRHYSHHLENNSKILRVGRVYYWSSKLLLS